MCLGVPGHGMWTHIELCRWYVVVVMGQKAGHLALGIGKAAAATLTLIPEEYKGVHACVVTPLALYSTRFSRALAGKPVKFSELCDVVEAAMIKRLANNKGYGAALVRSVLQ